VADRTVEQLHAITGDLGQIPLSPVPYVQVVPDDYLPAPRDEGVLSYSAVVALPGAVFIGVVIVNPAVYSRQDVAYELALDVLVGTGSSGGAEVEVVEPVNWTTDHYIGSPTNADRPWDTRSVHTDLYMRSRVDAAAHQAAVYQHMNATFIPDLTWVRLGEGLILGGAPLGRAVAAVRMVTVANAAYMIYVRAHYRRLYKRGA